MLDILEYLDQEYNWEKIKTEHDFEIYQGTYLDEEYTIIEFFENPEESELYFFSPENNIQEMDSAEIIYENIDNADMILLGCRVEFDSKQPISLYQDDDTFLILQNTKDKVLVYEDYGDLLDICKEELSDLLIDFPFEEKTKSKSFDYLKFTIIYYLLDGDISLTPFFSFFYYKHDKKD